MQKFTRPLTREIDVAGERLALTLDAEGITVRVVGTRKPPLQARWPQVIGLLGRPGTISQTDPPPEELKAALEAIRKGGTAPSASPTTAPAALAAPATPGAGPEMGQILARLEKWLAGHRREYLEGLEPGASPADLEALERQLGVAVPASLKALLGWHNGQTSTNASSFEESWFLMSTEDISGAKKDLDEGTEIAGWQRAWIPFLYNDDGDYVCLDTSQPKAPVREFWQDRKEHPIASPSLEAWLADKVQAMEQGEYHEDPERGYFLRAHARSPALGEGTAPR